MEGRKGKITEQHLTPRAQKAHWEWLHGLDLKYGGKGWPEYWDWKSPRTGESAFAPRKLEPERGSKERQKFVNKWHLQGDGSEHGVSAFFQQEHDRKQAAEAALLLNPDFVEEIARQKAEDEKGKG